MQKYILLTIDVEDWFQVENFRPWIPFETWDQYELRVERNVHRLLNLFDSVASVRRLEARCQKADVLKGDEVRKLEGSKDIEFFSIPASQPASLTQKAELKNNGQPTTHYGHTKKVHATFFVLGWIAERLPHLVREIHSRDHEVASHGYNHTLCNQLSNSELKKELTESKQLLEDITGSEVFGFRAPNFSISDDILKIIENCGYLYDSSYNSFGLHGRYGKISLNRHRKSGIAHIISENFFEIPISNLHYNYPLNLKRSDFARFVFPWGGGAYFRLMPLSIFIRGLKKILYKENTYIFYMHPWEFDSKQSKVRNASRYSKFKHYTNIRQNEKKLKKLIRNFYQYQFPTCFQYLNQSK